MTRLDEILHPSHPCMLKLEYTEMPFKCDGCKDLGIGAHYICALCDFDLHQHCANASPSINHHFFTECSFEFLLNPPHNIACDACGKDVTGFVYHCRKCGNDLHPCCAKLPMTLDVGDAKLYLYKKLSKSCRKCGGHKRRGWSYRPKNEEYQLGVGCVKEMIEENWQEVLEHGRSGMLQTRIPNLNNMLETHHQRGNHNKFRKFARFLRAVMGLLLGDPSPLIAEVIKSLLFEN